MLTTTQLKEYAQLSQAAYAYFDKSDLLCFGGKAEDAEFKLEEKGKGGGSGDSIFYSFGLCELSPERPRIESPEGRL